MPPSASWKRPILSVTAPMKGSVGPAVELLLSAMLAAAADLAGQSNAPAPQQAGVWLHAEILPKRLLNDAQAAALMRAQAFAQAPELPESLVQALLQDARALVAVA